MCGALSEKMCIPFQFLLYFGKEKYIINLFLMMVCSQNRLSDPNDKSKELAKKITELVVSSSVTIKEAMDAIRLSAELLDEMKIVRGG